MEQQQKRATLHFTAEIGAGAGAETGSSCSPATTPLGSNGNAGFLPDMPQWKKDLIQRRKTNVARTNAAASSPTTSTADGSSCMAFTEPAATTFKTEEKSEKCFIGAGGHQTLPAAAAAAAAASTQSTQGKEATAASSPETTTTATATAPIPKQRSSLFNTRSQSTGKEQQEEILNLDGRERDGDSERERACRERDEGEVNMLGSDSQQRSHHSASASGEVETGTAAAAATTTGALTATSSSSANQLQTKCKLGQSVDAEAAAAILPITTTVNDKNCKTKISDKLQSNKFIQNQQQQQQLAATNSKVAVKTTMVAMQEMKKTTTQNGQQRHHHHHHHLHHHQHQHQHNVKSAAAAAADVGVEDLSYGPGIVSKLRCRYLSLALRCEATRQQSQQQSQRLQRSTSLNTLLDRSDNDEEEEEEEEVEVNKPVKAVAPPIVGVKPTGYLKSGVNASIVQQRQQQQQQQQQLAAAEEQAAQQQRSRQFKRGNEVMKRARSVEALLCEKSPWHTQQRSTLPPPSAAATPASAASTVTIEDKISNARERLHSGTDATPPKRLTSIIDDTERPPPDLVRQTLKMFEASANRRPRSAQRSNGGVGGVASKVANYKSIIKEQKLTPGVALAASTPKQQQQQQRANNVPDIIPRQLEVNFETATARRKQQTEVGLPSPVVGGEIGGAKQQQHQQQQQLQQLRLVSDQSDDDDDEDDVTAGDEGKHEDEGRHEDAADDDNEDDVVVDDELCNGDKLGAAGDKLTAASLAETSSTAAAGGGGSSSVQRLPEHAANGSRKLPQRSSNDNDCGLSITNTPTTTTTTVTKQIGVIRPLLNQQASSSSIAAATPPLTSREIEKNRINEMKKSNALAADAAAAAALAASGNASLDNVINTNNKDASETDAAASPIWPHLRKRRQPAGGNAAGGGLGAANSLADNNTSMVFNFSKSSKEVPDYIESDVVIYRRKRELPKPNEPGFVLLGDLSVETSTDTDYDDYSMCPPSPCDVEFENANIVIDGKSSIRQKAKDSSFRVQFNDTLTSTFEYPSEASQIIDDPPYADPYGVNKHHQLLYEEQLILQQQQQQQQQHHHVTVDEIIELPTTTTPPATSSTKGASATSAMLGNLPLDYPSLGKGIILPELETKPEPIAVAVEVAVAVVSSKPSSRRRAAVLLKPQYACFLQNDAVQPPPPPSSQPQPARKAASFCVKQPSKYATPQTATKELAKRSSSSSYVPAPLLASRRTSLPTSNSNNCSSLALPNATTALLQTRIPGNTLYYV
ncbi:hypothetical protein KR044_007521 [Drosophila immigrans]|nr:hypothetical protein KR044_007521 [Drosophila immigrans]